MIVIPTKFSVVAISEKTEWAQQSHIGDFNGHYNVLFKWDHGESGVTLFCISEIFQLKKLNKKEDMIMVWTTYIECVWDFFWNHKDIH